MSYNSKYTGKQVEEILDKANSSTNITESTVANWGFTKNTGTYSKPSGGIPKTDLASAVQTSLGKADTALQSHQTIKTVNGQSLLGSGNIDACSYPVVNHGKNDTTFTLTPNTFHIWGEVTSLNLSLGAEVSGVVNEYVFQYSVGDSAPTLTFPETIVWVNPPIGDKTNTTYIVSIVNNIGLVVRT